MPEAPVAADCPDLFSAPTWIPKFRLELFETEFGWLVSWAEEGAIFTRDSLRLWPKEASKTETEVFGLAGESELLGLLFGGMKEFWQVAPVPTATEDEARPRREGGAFRMGNRMWLI